MDALEKHDLGGETRVKVMTDLLGKSTPSLNEGLKKTTESSRLDKTDMFVLEVAQEVLRAMKKKPTIGEDRKTSFEMGEEKERELVGAGVGNLPNEYDSGPTPIIPEYIKGNAKLSCDYDNEHDMPNMNIDINFEEILGSMNLSEEMPSVLSISFYANFTDVLTKKIKTKKGLPTVSVNYFLHHQPA